MTSRSRAFVGLGSNLGDRRATLETALGRLRSLDGTRLAAVSAAFENPAVGGPPQPDYWNAVAEVSTTLSPRALFEGLRALEAAAHRVRAERDGPRTLDLDLLAFGDVASKEPDLLLPHPRALDRAFTVGPWAEIAPEYVPPGSTASVVRHAASLRARDPSSFDVLRRVAILVPRSARDASAAGLRADVGPVRPSIVRDATALRALRDAARGVVGFVPTMGALHEGHAALVRRARAACDVVIASLFVNPLQFAPTEDLSRYPRTFEADLDLLAREGVDAVYAPSADDLYPPGFSTSVDVAGIPSRYEGAVRPGHFRGVATVVASFLARVRPDRSWFGRKDAQQAALVRRLARDLDLPGEVVVAPTVRDVDGLALSSRNRYLSPEERERALAFPRALRAASLEAAQADADVATILDRTRERLTRAGLTPDYVTAVDADTFEPVTALAVDAEATPTLLVATVRCGATRLLDNEWLATPSPVAAFA